MVIKKDASGKGVLVATGKDKFGRADARLVSLITKVTRSLKSPDAESTYHYEDTYKLDVPVMKFNWNDREKVANIVRQSSIEVTVENG